VHAITDIDQAARDFAAEAETKIGLLARPHNAGKFVGNCGSAEGDALDQNRPIQFRNRRRFGLATGKQQQTGDNRSTMACLEAKNR
jgi:hypothetical protein